MRLGGELALAGEFRARRELAVEARGKGLGVDRHLQRGGPRGAEFRGRGQFRAEADGLALPLELAVGSEGAVISGRRTVAPICSMRRSVPLSS